MSDKPYQIEYEFKIVDGKRKSFQIWLDPETITIIRPEFENKPDWTRLEHEKCKCCTLKKERHPHCPISVNIAELVDEFKDMISSDKCHVRCTTPERIYIKETYIQVGLFSIFGIIMATSNCPVMEIFKPMARFHLPFSTVEETLVRTTSFYLLRQYFEYKKGKTPDMNLKKLDEHYKKVQEVNEGILARIKKLTQKDADSNAIIIFNSLAQILMMELDENLSSLEHLFTLQSNQREKEI